MSHVGAIFILKPIIDLLHTDALQYVAEIKQLQERVMELEKENAQLREIIVTPIKQEPKEEVVVIEPIALKNIIIDDTVYAKEAETYTEPVQPVNIVVENTEKVVTVNMGEEKTRKEYQKEYQRQYRKMKKEKQQSSV